MGAQFIDFVAIGRSPNRKVADDHRILMTKLFDQNGDKPPECGPDGRIRRRHIMFDQSMKFGQIIIRDHRKHVMFKVIVHVEIDKAADRVHQHSSRVQPMI